MPASSWLLKDADSTHVSRLARDLGISPLLARLLLVRQVSDAASARRFLGQDPALLNPWELPGMEIAAERLLDALDAQERIVVYGDYDADGVTSTALLYSYLLRAGYNVTYFLPHRFEDGYGMNLHAIEELADQGARLIVTVDNGVSSVREVAYARELGMDVIVTDHHTPPAVLPEPYALLNPRLGGCPAEMSGLAGVGVAFSLAAALEQRAPSYGVEDLLDLVAIGSIADMAPLTGVNRTLVGAGLHLIATATRPGIKALADVAAVASVANMAAQDIGFRIGPRINAAGRMDHPEVALKLLLADDIDAAEELAAELERLNRLRQETSKRIEAEAHALVALEVDLEKDAVIVLAKEDWHRGIIGIVAARLVDAYGLPVILMGADGDHWKGSGRSPDSIHLFAALEACREHLDRFGGHAQAAGLALEATRLEVFRAQLNEAVKRQTGGERPQGPLLVDAEVSLAEVSPQLIRELMWLEPTGQGNPEPRLGLSRVQVLRQKQRGKDKSHLWLELRDGVEIREAVGFGMGGLFPVPDVVDVAFTPEFNFWQGQARVQMRLHAVIPSQSDPLVALGGASDVGDPR
jgi:single-stranded-DNA-specific exonuclease